MLTEKTNGFLAGTYESSQPGSVPVPEDIPLGNNAATFEAVTLFVDIRQSSDIAETFRLQTAAKMMKAYFDGAVRIASTNGGYVRSFNGDGMLALFRGDSQRNNAVKAAMQVKWFVRQFLRPKFERYFSNNEAALGQTLDFDVGIGVDQGTIFAVRVGIKGTNDVAWIGRGTNTAAKLAGLASSPRNIWITRAIYAQLNDSRKTSKGIGMWSAEEFHTIGGVSRGVRTTSYHWTVG